jgi:hypothetical protein
MSPDQVHSRNRGRQCILSYHEIRQYSDDFEPVRNSLTRNSIASWQKYVRKRAIDSKSRLC